MSFKALDERSLDGCEQWLTYWVCYAAFQLVPTLFVSWIPFYYEMELVFLLWLQSPQTQGATWLFDRYIQVHLKSREEAIDRHLSEWSTAGVSKVRTLSASYLPTVSKLVIDGVVYAQKVATSSLAEDAASSPGSLPEETTNPADDSIESIESSVGDVENAASSPAAEIVINGVTYTRTKERSPGPNLDPSSGSSSPTLAEKIAAIKSRTSPKSRTATAPTSSSSVSTRRKRSSAARKSTSSLRDRHSTLPRA